MVRPRADVRDGDFRKEGGGGQMFRIWSRLVLARRRSVIVPRSFTVPGLEIRDPDSISEPQDFLRLGDGSVTMEGSRPMLELQRNRDQLNSSGKSYRSCGYRNGLIISAYLPLKLTPGDEVR